MNAMSPVQTYHGELCRAMTWLGQQDSVMFFGQGVGVLGTSMSNTFDGVPAAKRIELPVAEEMQIGMCIGASLNGIVPVCVIPRWNFALRAADQIVNHMDRLPIYSNGGYKPKVIVRIAAPSVHPFNPGAQHDGDFTAAFRLMCRTIRFVQLHVAEAIMPEYRRAYESDSSTILVEYTEHYRRDR